MDNLEEKKLLSFDTEDSTQLDVEEPKVEVSEELSDEALESVAGGGYVVLVHEDFGFAVGW